MLSLSKHEGELAPQRWLVTPTRGQYRSTGQRVSHHGDTGRQMVCPKATSRSLYSIQYRRGSCARSACSVACGSLVCTYPQRFEMRWTCTSTQMPCLAKPWVITRLAVLRPTPFNVRRSSRLLGTFPSYRSSNAW